MPGIYEKGLLNIIDNFISIKEQGKKL